MNTKLDARIRRIAYGNLHLVTAKHRHFSFLVDGNKVVSWGFNKAFRTHPLALKFQHRFADIHSELAAIASFPYRVRELCNYEIVNVRIKRIDNLFGYASPCIYCIPMLQSFGLKYVTYSNGDGLWNVKAL